MSSSGDKSDGPQFPPVTAASDAVLDQLAREILFVDKDGKCLVKKFKQVIVQGRAEAPTTKRSKPSVVIIGAGIAGLVTGLLLKNAGYTITILEAEPNRVGGRIKTIAANVETNRGCTGEQIFQDAALHGEAGAMRLPRAHHLLFALIKYLGLSDEIRPFYNTDVDTTEAVPKETKHTWMYINGRLIRRHEYEDPNRRPDENDGAEDPPIDYAKRIGYNEVPLKQTAKQIYDECAKKALEPEFTTAFRTGRPPLAKSQPEDVLRAVELWKKVIRKYGMHSNLNFLMEMLDQPTQDTIDYLGTVLNQTSRLHLSFLHTLIDDFWLSGDAGQLSELQGGTSTIVAALRKLLEDDIVMNAQVTDIGERSTSTKDGHLETRVVVKTKGNSNPNASSSAHEPKLVRTDGEFVAHLAVVAIPFTALRMVHIEPMLSQKKREAIRQMHYDSATKVFLEFSHRWWEWSEEQWTKGFGEAAYRGHFGSVGGSTVTDLPSRFIYFPSHSPKVNDVTVKGGVIIAAYTWSDDASRWDSLPADERYNYALNDLCTIYGQCIRKYFTGRGASESWMNNRFVMGEAAVFSPGQIFSLHPHTSTREGLLHFAGEHTSLKHAWIEGAIESAVRVAIDIEAVNRPVNQHESHSQDDPKADPKDPDRP